MTMINKDIRVAIAEEDPFARNFLALLLARDWRTKAIEELDGWEQVLHYLKHGTEKVDILLIDTDILRNHKDVERELAGIKNMPRIFLIGNHVEEHAFKLFPATKTMGYVVKKEVGFSIAWALSLAQNGQWVMTPGVENYAADLAHRLPDNCVLLDGRINMTRFTDHELEAARLALIFSMERRDLANEMDISEEWSYGLVSGLYKKMGLEELLADDAEPENYPGMNELLMKHVREVASQLKEMRKKPRDMETLAFHFLTMPYIETCG